MAAELPIKKLQSKPCEDGGDFPVSWLGCDLYVEVGTVSFLLLAGWEGSLEN